MTAVDVSIPLPRLYVVHQHDEFGLTTSDPADSVACAPTWATRSEIGGSEDLHACSLPCSLTLCHSQMFLGVINRAVGYTMTDSAAISLQSWQTVATRVASMGGDNELQSAMINDNQ